MPHKIFVNLPVADLEKSKKFYTALGFTINPRFTDQNAACVVVSGEIYVMLLTHESFRRFTKKEIIDSVNKIEVINALTLESREEVDEMAKKSLDAGGKMSRNPENNGWMYTKAVEDPDGHIWELFWMDETRVEKTAQ